MLTEMKLWVPAGRRYTQRWNSTVPAETPKVLELTANPMICVPETKFMRDVEAVDTGLQRPNLDVPDFRPLLATVN